MNITVYRPTKAFIEDLKSNIVELDLYTTMLMCFCADKQLFDKGVRAINALLKNKQLIQVASVKSDLSNIVQLTQSITRSWVHNPEVTLLTEAKICFLSSSSIGDLIVDHEYNAYIIAPLGLIYLDGRADSATLSIKENP